MADMQDPLGSIGQPLQQAPMNPECTEFIDAIRPLIKEKGYDMAQIVTFQEITQLLDNLSFPSTFNKNLFHTIVISSGFSPDSPLSLEQFFAGFYVFYDTMIPNHERLINLNKQLAAKRDDYQTKAIQARNARVDPNAQGISSLYCEVLVEVGDLNNITDIEFSIQGQHKEAVFQSNTIVLPVQANQSDSPLQVVVVTSMGTQVVEEGMKIKDLFNQELTKNYSVSNVSFIIKYVLVENEVDYFSIKLINVEEEINANNDSLALLNRSISSMQNVFKNQLLAVTSTNEPIVFKSEGNFIEKEFDIMNNIEDVLIRTTKVSYINWNKIAWYATLAMCPFVFINFFLRFDIVTLLFTCAVFGVYYRQIRTVYLKRIVCMVLLSFVIDFIWVFYYLDAWGINLPYEWQSETTIRQIMLVSCFVLMIIKLLIAFALWKLSLQSQLISINEPSNKISRISRAKASNNDTSSRQPPHTSFRHVPNKNETTNRDEILIRKPEESDNDI